MSIWDNARRIASEGVAAFASHQAKRGPDKLPGRKVSLSGWLLLIESVSRLRNLTEQVVDVFNCSKVPVVQTVQFVVVVGSRKAVGPFDQVFKHVPDLGNLGGVIIYG